MATKETNSTLSLEEQVLQIKVAQATSGSSIHDLLRNSRVVPVGSAVRVDAQKKLRKYAFANMHSIESCELLINAHRNERWWPCDEAFKQSIVKRICARAQTWEQFEHVMLHCSRGTKMHHAATEQMYSLLRAEYQPQIDATTTFQESRELLSKISRIRDHKWINHRRLQRMYSQLLRQMYDRAALCDEVRLLLAFDAYTGERREHLWQRALAMSNTASSLCDLLHQESAKHRGVCLQKALDLCVTVDDCLQAYEHWSGNGAFGVKAIESWLVRMGN